MSDETQGGPPKPPEENEPTAPPTPPGDPAGPPPASPPPYTPPTGSPPPSSGGAGESAAQQSDLSPAMWAHVGAAIITILCVCAPLAFVPPLIFFLTNKDKSPFVSFHALQALFLFGATSAINLVMGMAGLTGLIFLTGPLAMIINIAAGVYGIVIGMKANKGEWAEYVLVGQLAKDQLKN